ncbi:MAG TPA: hypothetical protein VL854_06830 [Nitrososphaeraceae archaeon]|nr:hypothetical protein [Nitrososphaeraceae archaeon]
MSKNILEQVKKDVQHKVEELVIAEPEQTLESLNNLLKQKYHFTFDEEAIAYASEDPTEPEVFIVQRRYDESKLNILEDIHTNDWTANECVQKKAHFIWGRHGKTVLDIKYEPVKDADKRMMLRKLYDNPRYTNSKLQLDLINCQESIDIHTKGVEGTISALVYGRAAIQVIRGKKSQAELEDDSVTIYDKTVKEDSTMPTALKMLNSRRLGRIKVKDDKIISVEYLDVKKKGPNGEALEVEEKDKFLPIEDLIYIVNPEGGVSTNSQYTGVSRLESIVNISMVKRIIMNQNIKEAAKSHYAGLLMAKFPEETESSVMMGWIANAAKAAGRWFATKLNVAIEHWKADTDLDKYASLVTLLDNAIIRAIGIPSALVGYESVKYSNMEELLIAWREGELQFWRTWVKGWLSPYLNNLFKKILGNIPTNDKEEPEPIAPYPPDPKKEEDKEEPPTDNPEVEESMIPITDAVVKISYEFQDISFLPKKEIIEGLKMLKEMGIALTDEMILRIAGYDEWVEEIMHNKEEQEAQKKEEAKERMEKLMEENELLKSNSNETFYRGGFSQGRPIPASTKEEAVAAAEDTLMNKTMTKHDELIDEKIKTLKILQSKIEALN